MNRIITISNSSSKLIFNYFKQNSNKLNFTTSSSSIYNSNDNYSFNNNKKYNFNEIRNIKFNNNNNNEKNDSGSGSGENNFKIYKSKLEMFKNQNLKIDNKFYFEFMVKFQTVKQFEQVIKVYNDYESDGYQQHDDYIITTAMDAYASLKDMNKCLELYNEKLINQSVIAYTILITGYLECGDFESSMKWLDTCLNDQEIDLDIGAFTSLISKLSRAGQFSIIDMVLNQIQSKEIPMDNMFYTSLIKGLSQYKGVGKNDRLINYVEKIKSDSNVIIDSKLFTSILDSFTFKSMYKEAIDFFNQYYHSIVSQGSGGEEYYFISIAKSYKFICPKSIETFHEIWSKIESPQAKHYFNYFNTLNTMVENGWFSIKECNLPEIVEMEIEKLSPPPNELHIFQTNISIVNQIIRWHLHQGDISLAWSVFQYTLSNGLADSKTFYYILNYFSKRCDEIIVYNNIKEILTSSYYINLIQSNSSTYQKEIYLPIIKSLSSPSSNLTLQRKQFLDLMSKFTQENISYYSKSLNNYNNNNN